MTSLCKLVACARIMSHQRQRAEGYLCIGSEAHQISLQAYLCLFRRPERQRQYAPHKMTHFKPTSATVHICVASLTCRRRRRAPRPPGLPAGAAASGTCSASVPALRSRPSARCCATTSRSRARRATLLQAVRPGSALNGRHVLVCLPWKSYVPHCALHAACKHRSFGGKSVQPEISTLRS